MDMLTVLKTGPTVTPVSLDDVKTHLNIPISNTLFDLKLSGFIETAVNEAEYETGRKIITQSWSVIYQGWPSYGIYENTDDNSFGIPYGQLQSVESIEYTVQDGTVNTLSTTIYHVDLFLNRVILKDYQSWPTDDLFASSPINISFTCGWDPEEVPEGIRTAIMIRVADLFNNLEDITILPGLSGETNLKAFSRILFKYRIL